MGGGIADDEEEEVRLLFKRELTRKDPLRLDKKGLATAALEDEDDKVGVEEDEEEGGATAGAPPSAATATAAY